MEAKQASTQEGSSTKKQPLLQTITSTQTTSQSSKPSIDSLSSLFLQKFSQLESSHGTAAPPKQNKAAKKATAAALTMPAQTTPAPVHIPEPPKPLISQPPQELLELSTKLEQVFGTAELEPKQKMEEMFKLYQ